MARPEDLDLSPAPVESRWTLDKLARAGWVEHTYFVCSTCGEVVWVWRNESAVKTRKMQLIDITLERHLC